MAENTIDLLEIYMAYDRLKVKDLASCLLDLSEISAKIAEDYFARFNKYAGEELPTLDIETINTGNSIKFQLKEGWMPSFSNSKENDIIISVPKGLGIPILMAHLLIYGANSYVDFRNKELDMEIKKVELKLKERELAKAIGLDNEKEQSISIFIDNYVENKVPEVKHIVNRTIKNILVNPNITQFKVNNVEIKNQR